MEYMSARDAAEKWGITQRRVSILCAGNRIDGIKKIYENKNSVIAKPFVKWAGGKGQLLSDIRKTYPKELGETITKYAEPFVGGGAVLFDILNTYPTVKEVYISDINAELI
ncbi:MAG: DNA adenine methylase, partial [Anaerovoracaceae bacterium]